MWLQVRVVMGKEPQHFMSMFDGKMIIFSVSVLLQYILKW